MTAIHDIEVTDADLAILAGVTARHIRRLALPKIGRNAYRLADVFQPLLESLSGGPAGGDLTRERTRLASAQANKAELEFAKLRGDVALLEEVKAAWAKIMAAIQQNIMNVPVRAVLQLLGETDETVFKAKLRGELILALKQAAETKIDLDDDTEEEFSDEEETED